jgi:predicted DNA-binding ArsR family transcriptional regulator
MIDYLTFIDELKELKPVVVSLDDTVEDTDTKINKLIKKYETIMTEHEKEENNEPSRT